MNRSDRREQAQAHTGRMAKEYASDISLSVAGTKVYRYKVPALRDGETCIKLVPVKTDTVSAIFSLKSVEGVCVLNFASYKHAGEAT